MKAEIFQLLASDWEIVRTITPGGVFEGQGVFTPSDHLTLDYEERGTLTLDNGEVLQPSKKYLYKLEGEIIAVYFADGPDSGKLFHRFDESDQAEHLCGEDFYKSSYKLNLPGRFTITHEVKGPRKDYKSVSVFSKLC